MDKQHIYAHLKGMVSDRIEATSAEVRSLMDSRDNDSKSTAGDKHEVGRAMAQTEIDALQAQLARHQSDMAELERVVLDRSVDEVGYGSLVTSDAGVYFISIGLGVVDTAEGRVYCVSPAAPVGRALIGARLGEKVTFNGRTLSVDRID